MDTKRVIKSQVAAVSWGKPQQAQLKDAWKNIDMSGLPPHLQRLLASVFKLFSGLENDLYSNHKDKKQVFCFNYLVNTLLGQISRLDLSDAQAESIKKMLDASTEGQKKVIQDAVKQAVDKASMSSSVDAALASMPDVDKFASQFVDSLTKVSDKQKDVLGRFISDSFTSQAERLEKKQAETVKNTIVEQFKTELDGRRNAPQPKQQEDKAQPFGSTLREKMIAKINASIQASALKTQKIATAGFTSAGKAAQKSMKLLTPTAMNTMIIAAATKQILSKIISGIWSVATFPFTAVNRFIIKPILNGIWSLVKLPFKLIGGLLGKVWSGLKGCFMFSISNIWKFIKTPAGLALLAYGAGYVYGRWIKPFWDRHVAPFLHDMQILYNMLIPLWNNTVKPFWNDILVPFAKWGWNFLKTDVPKFIDWINETAIPFYNERLKPAIEKVYNFFESIGKFMGVENPFLAALTGFFATDTFVIKIVPIIAKVLLYNPGLAFSIGKALLAPLGLVGLGAYLSNKTHASIGTSTSFVAAGATQLGRMAKGGLRLRNAGLDKAGYKTVKMTERAIRAAQKSEEMFRRALEAENAGNAKLAEKYMQQALKYEQKAKNMKNAGFMTRALRNVKGATNKVAERIGIKTASKFGAEFMAKHSGLAKGLAKTAKFAPVIGAAAGAWDIYDSINETNKIKAQGEIAENDNAFKLDRLDRQLGHGITDIAATGLLFTPAAPAAGFIMAYNMIESAIDGITERSEELTKKALDVGEIKDFMNKSVNVAKDINEAVKRGDADMKDQRMHGYAEIFEQVHAMNADIDRVAKELGSAGAWSAWIGKTQDLSMKQDQKLMALKELLLKNGFTSFKDFQKFERENGKYLEENMEKLKQENELRKEEEKKEKHQMANWDKLFIGYTENFNTIISSLNILLGKKPESESNTVVIPAPPSNTTANRKIDWSNYDDVMDMPGMF